MRNSIGQLNVRQRRLDVLHSLLASLRSFDGPLVLAHKRNRVNQREVLLMVPAQPRRLVGEGEELRIRVQHLQRPEQPLRVLMQRHQRLLLPVGQQPLQRPARPLALMNRTRLLTPLIHRQHQTPIHQLFINIACRRREEQRHRPLNPVFLGDQVARGGIFARAGNRQLTF